MPEVKLFDSERKIMECLWQGGEMSAKELAEELEKTVGWSKPTTYTVPVSYTHLTLPTNREV